jgi:predicted amidohydrolase YtcJ
VVIFNGHDLSVEPKELQMPLLGWSNIQLRRWQVLLAAAFLAVGPALAADNKTAVIHGGDILTMEGDAPAYVEALVVKDGLIAFVGTKAEALKRAGARAKRYDLNGKTLLPGFIDPHLHPVQGASMLMPKYATPFDWKFPWGDAPAVRGQEAFLETIKGYEAALKSASEPLVVWGYLTPFHGDLDRGMLDKISQSRPIIVWSYSAHEFYLNTAALKAYGLTQEQVAGNSQADFPKGLYREAAAFDIVVPRILPVIMNPKEIPTGLRRLRDLAHIGGITTVGDMGTGSAGQLHKEVGAIRSILDNDATPFRMRLAPDVKTLDLLVKDDGKVVATVKSLPDSNSSRLLFGTQVKLYADGAFFAQAMQLEKPGYADGHEGEWIMPPDRLRHLIGLWWKRGYDIHIHCNGSLALTFILDSLEQAKSSHEGKGQRLIIEHFGVSTPEQVKRIKKLGVAVSANPYYYYSMADTYAQGNLGPEQGGQIVRLGSLSRHGVPFALHSDFTMAPMEPLFLAWIAANRITALGNKMAPEEKVSVYKALQGITINAAFVLRLESMTGSIAKGKRADFVLLAENPLKVDPMKIKDIAILGTVFEGKPYPIETCLLCDTADNAGLKGGLNPIPSGGVR